MASLGCPGRVPRGWHLPPAANPTFLGNSQTPGTSGRLIIDISGAGLSLRTLPDVGKYLLIAFSCLTNPNFLCLRCWVSTFQEPFLDEFKDYFLMEIRNLRRAGGSDSRWSLHLILMETEQLWAPTHRIWQAGNVLEHSSSARVGCELQQEQAGMRWDIVEKQEILAILRIQSFKFQFLQQRGKNHSSKWKELRRKNIKNAEGIKYEQEEPNPGF